MTKRSFLLIFLVVSLFFIAGGSPKVKAVCPCQNDNGDLKAEFESEEKREATREFLSTYFEFDPNIHVKSAYDEKLAQKDPERAKTVKARRKILKNRNKQKSIDMENLTKNTPITEIPTHTMQDLPMTKSQALGETNEPDGEEKFAIPPMDTFHRWRLAATRAQCGYCGRTSRRSPAASTPPATRRRRRFPARGSADCPRGRGPGAASARRDATRATPSCSRWLHWQATAQATR